jgi:hypothetical protein
MAMRHWLSVLLILRHQKAIVGATPSFRLENDVTTVASESTVDSNLVIASPPSSRASLNHDRDPLTFEVTESLICVRGPVA